MLQMWLQKKTECLDRLVDFSEAGDSRPKSYRADAGDLERAEPSVKSSHEN